MNEQTQQHYALSHLRKWVAERGVDRLIELSQSEDKGIARTCKRRLGALVHELQEPVP
jgi:hypothetical protein